MSKQMKPTKAELKLAKELFVAYGNHAIFWNLAWSTGQEPYIAQARFILRNYTPKPKAKRRPTTIYWKSAEYMWRRRGRSRLEMRTRTNQTWPAGKWARCSVNSPDAAMDEMYQRCDSKGKALP
jgi:hypothetical protein